MVQEMSDPLAALGILIKHHFGTHVYVKETHIPANIPSGGLPKHTHSFDHLSVLVSGTAIVEVDGVSTIYDKPTVLTIEAGKKHKVTAITDVMWLCIHATDDKNPDTVDVSLMSKIVKE